MSLKIKLFALTAMSLALVVTSACKGGADKAKEKAKEACNQMARVCKDGKNAVREDDNSCYQSCPEDKTTSTATSTVTQTQTQTRTQTTTVTQTSTNTAAQ